MGQPDVGAWEAHLWLPDVTVGNRIMGPNEVGRVEAALSALTDTGLYGDEQMDAVRLVSSHTRNTRSADTVGTLPWTPTDNFPTAPANNCTNTANATHR